MGGPEPDEIVVDHLTKQYKRLRAVDDLSGAGVSCRAPLR